MKRVLVTGSNGFVGRHLVSELIAHDVAVVSVGGPSRRDIQGETKATEHMTIDLTDPTATQKITFQGIDGVIHLAGLAAVGPSFDQPNHYIATNVGMEINLFEAALAQGVSPRFLIISSAVLYDPKAGLPLTEVSPVRPSSPYAVSKLTQDYMAQYYQQRGFETIIARPFNHIGPGQAPGFIVADLAKQIVDIERGTAKKILVGNLKSERDYTDVRDIVRAYRLLLEKGCPGEIYNICSGERRSGQELLDGLLQNSQITPTVEADPAKARPVEGADIIYGSHDKLTKDTGWQPEISIEQTLEDVMQDWRSREA